jgi:adenine deaminase
VVKGDATKKGDPPDRAVVLGTHPPSISSFSVTRARSGWIAAVDTVSERVGMPDFRRTPLHEMTRRLAATARGDLPATLVVRGGTLVSVTSGEVLPDTSVAAQGPRIAYVGPDASHTIGDETRVVEAEGRYMAPGFLDGHCHIESTQLTVTQFARAVLPLGTTGGFFDAHEITNVLGLRGLRLMIEEARTTPLAAYMQVASCVPSTSTALETPGAVIGPDEVAEALGWGEDVIGLGEVMNFPGVVFGDEKMHGEIDAALRVGRIADGHFAWPPDDWRLAAYAASGITGCHEGTTAEDTVWRLRSKPTASVASILVTSCSSPTTVAPSPS